MKNSRIFFLLLLSSLLYFLSFPNFIFCKGLGFLSWFCLIPVFFVLDEITLDASVIWGFFYGILCYGFTCFWLFNYGVIFFTAALLFAGLSNGVLFVLMKLPSYKKPLKSDNSTAFITRIMIFSSYEFLKTRGFFGISYGVLGYTQYEYTRLIQSADLFGVYGISFLIVMSSGVISALLKSLIIYCKKNKSSFLKQNQIHVFILPGISAFIFLVLFFVNLIYGNIKLKGKSESVNKISVISVQHNENPSEKGFESYAKNLNLLMNLTDEALSLYPNAEIVLWPETSVTPSVMYQYYYGTDERRVNLINNLLNFMNNRDCSFVIGNYHKSEEKDYNAALYFTPKKNVNPPGPEMYFKQHLVPLSETFPFENSFLSVKNLLSYLGASFWTSGKEDKIFVYKNEISDEKCLYFSTPICFEDTFPDGCRKMVQKGSRCFMNLTNDSWGKSLSCQNQHLAMAVFRSLENHIPSVRSASSGMTCFINEYGEIGKYAPPFSESFVFDEIPVLNQDMPLSFYTKKGDVFSFVILIFSITLLLIDCIKGILFLWQK